MSNYKMGTTGIIVIGLKERKERKKKKRKKNKKKKKEIKKNIPLTRHFWSFGILYMLIYIKLLIMFAWSH